MPTIPPRAGLPIYTQEDELNALVLAADKAGLQIAAHAIGDKANAWILECLGPGPRRRTAAATPATASSTAQVVAPEDVARFRELGVIASIQPSHCIDDMRWAGKAHRHQGRATRTVSPPSCKAGVRLAFGTDWDVEPLDPRLGLYAAVSRELPGGGPAGGWHPDEKLSLATGHRGSIPWARPTPNSRKT